jgi:hypothetical protein
LYLCSAVEKIDETKQNLMLNSCAFYIREIWVRVDIDISDLDSTRAISLGIRPSDDAAVRM